MIRCLVWIRDRLLLCGFAFASCSLATNHVRWHCFSGNDTCEVALDECFVCQKHCRAFAQRSTGITERICAIGRVSYCFRDARDACFHCTAEYSDYPRAKWNPWPEARKDVRPYDGRVDGKLFVPGMCVEDPGGVIKMITRFKNGKYLTVDWHKLGWTHLGTATPSELKEQKYTMIQCPTTR